MRNVLKICLFNPIKCISYPPLNLASLATYLAKYGEYKYDIKLVDINFSVNPIAEILSFNPDVVGFTSMSPFMLRIYDFCNQLKAKQENILLVCGGVHATINPYEVVEQGFDIAVFGEGEITFKELIDGYIESSAQGDYRFLADIAGIAYRNIEQEIVKNKERELISDLDQIPHPDRFLLNNKGYHDRYYIMRGMNTFGIHTVHGSRGCPYNCIFCCVNFTVKSKVRFNSPEYISDEIQILVNKYKARWIFFTDDTFLVNKAHTEKLCQLLITRGLDKKINWEAQIRSNLIKEKDIGLLRLMRRAGCRQIDIGFESGNQRMLTLIKGSGITVADHQRAIDLINQAGINILGTFIIGTPSETYAEMLETKQFIKANYKKINRLQTGFMVPYPGTEVYDMAVSRGVIEEDYLKLLARQQQANPDHDAIIYSNSVPREKIQKLKIELDNLSFKKVSAIDKIRWLLYNLTHHPIILFNGIMWVGRKFAKHSLSLLQRLKKSLPGLS